MPRDAAELRAAIEAALDDVTIASSEPLYNLSALARGCLDQKDDARRAVAYALWGFLVIEARDRHEATTPLSEATAFRDNVDGPLRRAVVFIHEGGSAELATRIISDLSRL